MYYIYMYIEAQVNIFYHIDVDMPTQVTCGFVSLWFPVYFCEVCHRVVYPIFASVKRHLAAAVSVISQRGLLSA